MYRIQNVFSVVIILCFFSCSASQKSPAFNEVRVRAIEKQVALKLFDDLAHATCEEYNKGKYPQSIAAYLVRCRIARIYQDTFSDYKGYGTDIPKDILEAAIMVFQSRGYVVGEAREKRFKKEDLENIDELESITACAAWQTRATLIQKIQQKPEEYEHPQEHIAALLLLNTRVRAHYAKKLIGDRTFANMACYKKDFFSGIVSTGRDIACAIIAEEQDKK